MEMNPFRLKVQIRKRLKEYDLDISFTAGRGCLGILGASGCGKSMTLKSVAGIVTPDLGKICLCSEGSSEEAVLQVLFDSEKKINLRPQKRRVGYLFQNYALFPNMTVKENIASGLAGRGHKECVAEMIKRFRLEGLESHYPGQLSGGQQQRVALARILAYDPDVILLDEPFSAMDAYLKEGLRLELSNVLNRYQKPAVLVTHDRDEAYQLCSHLLLMDKGKVIGAGRTRELFENPGNCLAARLTGCKNISRIRRLGDYRVKALDWGGLELAVGRLVTEDISAVGIRAHDFEPLSSAEAQARQNQDGANLIPVGNPEVSEMPFQWQITLENGLWWKREKDMYTHDSGRIIPEWLRVDPSAILLLQDT